jgi:hypothetical protein
MGFKIKSSGIYIPSKKINSDFLDKINNKDKGLLLAVLLLSEGSIYKKKGLLNKIFKYKEVVFKMNDPLPSLFQFLTLFELLYRKIKYKKNILSASTFDIEWNGKDFE